MSSFFEELNDLIIRNSAAKVLAIALLILIGCGVVAMAIVFLILKFIYRHIS